MIDKVETQSASRPIGIASQLENFVAIQFAGSHFLYPAPVGLMCWLFLRHQAHAALVFVCFILGCFLLAGIIQFGGQLKAIVLLALMHIGLKYPFQSVEYRDYASNIHYNAAPAFKHHQREFPEE